MSLPTWLSFEARSACLLWKPGYWLVIERIDDRQLISTYLTELKALREAYTAARCGSEVYIHPEILES